MDHRGARAIYCDAMLDGGNRPAGVPAGPRSGGLRPGDSRGRGHPDLVVVAGAGGGRRLAPGRRPARGSGYRRLACGLLRAHRCVGALGRQRRGRVPGTRPRRDLSRGLRSRGRSRGTRRHGGVDRRAGRRYRGGGGPGACRPLLFVARACGAALVPTGRRGTPRLPARILERARHLARDRRSAAPAAGRGVGADAGPGGGGGRAPRDGRRALLDVVARRCDRRRVRCARIRGAGRAGAARALGTRHRGSRHRGRRRGARGALRVPRRAARIGGRGEPGQERGAAPAPRLRGLGRRVRACVQGFDGASPPVAPGRPRSGGRRRGARGERRGRRGRPGSALRGLQDATEPPGHRSCRIRPRPSAQRRRERPLAVLERRGRPVRGAPVRGRRGGQLPGLVAAPRVAGLFRPGRALALPGDPRGAWPARTGVARRSPRSGARGCRAAAARVPR